MSSPSEYDELFDDFDDDDAPFEIVRCSRCNDKPASHSSTELEGLFCDDCYVVVWQEVSKKKIKAEEERKASTE